MEYIVNTPCGAVRGARSRTEGIIAYKGIRYATAGRFEYPTEVTSWEGVYDATEYGACAYQYRAFVDEREVPKKAFFYNEFRRNESYTYSEDCLFLNLFTPEEGGEKLPVLIYIHGGSFTGGCGHEKHLDTPIWPKKGVIGVTLNYRLGPLGFAVLPELEAEAGKTGNYGLYDQLTAIRWVKHNVAAFGGDPDNITIMGQSAGAMSVQQHCLSPLSRGLFSRAVMCSGGGVSKMLAARKPKRSFKFWKMIMAECGAETLEEFRRVPVEELYRVWLENKKASLGGGCTPTIDGELVVGAGHTILKRGEQSHIPYLIGTTSQDFVPPILYSMARKWCTAQDTPSYLWFFEKALPGDGNGAWHTADLWYWFGTLDNCWRPFTDRDRALAEEMTDRLVAFAKDGNPNTERYTEWRAGGDTALAFGDSESVERRPSTLTLWKTMFTYKNPGE